MSAKVESLGQMKQRHKRELKDLEQKTKEILHSFSKNDKEAKKIATEKAKKMENELKNTHEQEILEKTKEVEQKEILEAIEEIKISEKIEKGPSKNEKKKAAKEKAFQERLDLYKDEIKDRPDQRALESEAIAKRCPDMKIYEIISDGNCLYRAIAHQLELLQHGTHSVDSLRCLCADYISKHVDQFLPFLNEDLDDDFDLESYLQDLRSSSKSVWGGQPEIVALSDALNVSIRVFSSNSTLIFGKGDVLNLSFHRFYFGLGEHYNSLLSK